MCDSENIFNVLHKYFQIHWKYLQNQKYFAAE